MSDYSRIKARLKKSKIEFKEEKNKIGNSIIEFGAVKIYIDKRNRIVGIHIFDIRVDIDKCVEKWSNDSSEEYSFTDYLII